MPRRKLKPRQKRILSERDIKYNSILVARLINKLMWEGKKTLASNIVYDAFEIIKNKTKQEPLQVFNQAIQNARPLLEVRPRRIGGATFQVPVEVEKLKGETLAMRWLIQSARSKSGKPMSEKLAEEIILASRKEGPVIKKREDLHKMAEANRAFAHYRW